MIEWDMKAYSSDLRKWVQRERSMTDDVFKYHHGYSIGVGAVVVCGTKVLLVRLLQGEGKGEWAIPGGFVEPEETIDQAVHREVWEETGIKAELKGLLAARSRVSSTGNSCTGYLKHLSQKSWINLFSNSSN
jgi:8-oxo-dGTP pyrophosphatase MutT (NUDIX family)